MTEQSESGSSAAWVGREFDLARVIKTLATRPEIIFKKEGLGLARSRELFLAAEALGQLKSGELPNLRTALYENFSILIEHGNSLHKVRTLRALRHIPSDSCVPILERALADKSGWVRTTALYTLMRMNLRSEVPRGVLFRFFKTAATNSLLGPIRQMIELLSLSSESLRRRNLSTSHPIPSGILSIGSSFAWGLLRERGGLTFTVLFIALYVLIALVVTGEWILLISTVMVPSIVGFVRVLMTSDSIRSRASEIRTKKIRPSLSQKYMGTALLIGKICLVLLPLLWLGYQLVLRMRSQHVLMAFGIVLFLFQILTIGVMLTGIPLILLLFVKRFVQEVRIWLLARPRKRPLSLREHIAIIAETVQDDWYPMSSRVRAVLSLQTYPLADQESIDLLLDLAEEHHLPIPIKDAIYQIVDAAEKRIQRGQRNSPSEERDPTIAMTQQNLTVGALLLPSSIRWFIAYGALALFVYLLNVNGVRSSSTAGSGYEVGAGLLLTIIALLAAPERPRLCRGGLVIGLGLLGLVFGDSLLLTTASLWGRCSSATLGMIGGHTLAILLCDISLNPADQRRSVAYWGSRGDWAVFVGTILLVSIGGAALSLPEPLERLPASPGAFTMGVLSELCENFGAKTCAIEATETASRLYLKKGRRCDALRATAAKFRLMDQEGDLNQIQEQISVCLLVEEPAEAVSRVREWAQKASVAEATSAYTWLLNGADTVAKPEMRSHLRAAGKAGLLRLREGSLFGGCPGIVVFTVVPGTQAQKKGLQSGDIILRYQKQCIRSIKGLQAATSNTEGGPEVDIDIIQEGRSEHWHAQGGRLGVEADAF